MRKEAKNMNTKENIKNEILMKMKHHLGTLEYSMLETVLHNTLYDVEMVKSEIDC